MSKKSMFSLKWILIPFSLLLVFCHFPYEPETEPEPVTGGTPRIDQRNKVYPVIGASQICNPSISLDTNNFPGCMLWLNFSGNLPVNIPDSLQEFAGESAQHDRLTIIDTSNTIRWYMKREELYADEREEFQDPEWSAHPDFIVCLLSSEAKKKWGSYVIHPKSRNYFKICNEGLNETSTPHIWVGPSATVGDVGEEITYDNDGFADSASVHRFFGTLDVKFVTAKKIAGTLSLYLKDYTSGGPCTAIERPHDRDGWNCESPLISPDGGWITFNAYEYEDDYEIYIQELSTGSRPLLFTTDASDPHWWVHPRDTSLRYLVYQKVPGWNLVEGDLSDEQYAQTGELGSTFRQMIRLFTDAPTESSALVKMGLSDTLINLPMKGGLSPDGRFLCTGYERAFIVGLP